MTANPTVVISGYTMPDSVTALPGTGGESFARLNFWKLTQVTLQLRQASDIRVQQRQRFCRDGFADLLPLQLSVLVVQSDSIASDSVPECFIPVLCRNS